MSFGLGEACFNDYAESDDDIGSGDARECSTHINADMSPCIGYKYDSMACLLPIRDHSSSSICNKVATTISRGRKLLPWGFPATGGAVVHVTSHTHLPLLTLFYEYFFLRFAVFNQQWPAIAAAVRSHRIEPPQLVEVYDLTAITQGWPRASLLFPSVVASRFYNGGVAPSTPQVDCLTWDQFRDIFPDSFISALYSVISLRPLGLRRSGKPSITTHKKMAKKDDGWPQVEKRTRHYKCVSDETNDGYIDSNSNNRVTDTSLFDRLVEYRFYEVDIVANGPTKCLDLVVFY
jgi:hypothetical protein